MPIHSQEKNMPKNDYHKVVKCPNGYSASIICNEGSYGGKDGKFTIAVLDKNGEITYKTPITSDVLGWLDFGDVAEILKKIESLPHE